MKGIKIIAWILCLLAILVFIFIAAIPSWISTASGTQRVLRWVNANIDECLSVDHIQLSWLGKQRLDNVALTDPDGTLIFSLKHFETKTSLLYLVLGGRSLNQTNVESPFLFLKEGIKKEEQKKPSHKMRKKMRSRGFDCLKGPLVLSNGEVIFAKHKLPLTLSSIQMEKKNRQDPLHLRAKTQCGSSDGLIAIDADLCQKDHAKIHLVDFPLALFDQLTTSSLYTTAFGPLLNVDVEFTREKDGSLFLKGSASSANLTAFIDGRTEDKHFILSPQTHLQLVFTPSLFKLLIDEEKRGDWNLASKTELEIQIEKGIFPLALNHLSYKEIILQARAQIQRAELHHSELGSYTLKQLDAVIFSQSNLEINYQGEILGKEATHFDGNISITPQFEILYHSNFKGFPITLVGLFSSKLEGNLRFLLGSQFDLITQGTIIDRKIASSLAITSPKIESMGKIAGDFKFLNFEIQGTRFITGEKADLIGSSLEFSTRGELLCDKGKLSLPSLTGKLFNPYLSLDLKGEIKESESGLLPENMQFILSGALAGLPTNNDLSLPTLKDVNLRLNIDGTNNQIDGKVSGEALLLDFKINDFIKRSQIEFTQAKVDFNAELKQFPIGLLNPLVSQTIDLSAFLGPKLTLHAKGCYAPHLQPRLILDLTAQSEGFSTALAITANQTLTVNPEKPSYIYWQLTPKRYITLMQQFKLSPETEPTFILTSPTDIKLHIKQLTCPTTWPKKLNAFLCQGGLVGDLEIGNMTFHSHNKREMLLFEGIKGAIKGVDFSQAIDLDINGKIVATPVPQTEQSAFSFEGKMLNFWTQAGHFNREGLTLKGILKLDLLPVRPILGIIPLDPQTRTMAQAVLGELVNAQIQGEISQLTGPLTVDIKSSNFKGLFPLQLQPSAILLRDFVDAEITLTREVNEVFLKDINPLLLTGAYSDHPIKVYIQAEGFMIPLHPYRMEGIQIARAVVDIGRIRVRNGGQIKALTDFLKAKEASPDGMMQAWFTPIYLSYHNGVASYARFDALLATNIHIALWGSINLINNQVNMTLGISPATMHQRFKFSGLGAREMFQVKMRGTTDRLELDWGSASTRLGFILARVASSGLGSLIGGLLESLSSALGEQPTPPATTDPLPWERR